MNPKTLSLVLISTLINLKLGSASVFVRDDSPMEGVTDRADSLSSPQAGATVAKERGEKRTFDYHYDPISGIFQTAFASLDDDDVVASPDKHKSKIRRTGSDDSSSPQHFASLAFSSSFSSPWPTVLHPSEQPMPEAEMDEALAEEHGNAITLGPTSAADADVADSDVADSDGSSFGSAAESTADNPVDPVEIFGTFHVSGVYGGPKVVYENPGQMRALNSFWEHVQNSEFDSASLIAHRWRLQINPANPLVVARLRHILSTWTFRSRDIFHYLWENFPDLLTLNPDHHENVYSSASQAAINYISNNCDNNDMINDRLLEACIMNQDLELDQRFYTMYSQNGVLRNIMVALLASNGYTEALKMAIQVPESLDFFYPDGESVLDKAIRMNHLTAINLILSRPDGPVLTIIPNENGLIPLESLSARGGEDTPRIAQMFANLLTNMNDSRNQAQFDAHLELVNDYITAAHGNRDILEAIQQKVINLIEEIEEGTRADTIHGSFITEYIELFDKTVTEGFISNPDDSDWIDTLRSVFGKEVEEVEDAEMEEQEEPESESEFESEEEFEPEFESEEESDEDDHEIVPDQPLATHILPADDSWNFDGSFADLF